MSTFNLPNTSPAVPVTLTDDLEKDKLLTFPAFRTWLSTIQHSLALQADPQHVFHESPYQLRSIKIQACDYFGGGRIGFLKMKAEVTNDKGEWLPGGIFLRGGSVGMLLVLSPKGFKDEKYTILTVQPRIAAGSLAFVEIPAGMLDDSGTFAGKAAEEIKEEVGLEVPQSELVDMTALAMEANTTDAGEENLQKAVYPSSGGSDEFVPLLLWEKEMERKEIEQLKGKLTGLRDHGEKITLHLCPLQDMWKAGARDGKTLAAFALYNGLKKEGKI
ncbi:MAG: hypothetical protein Q9227_002911 [Pyrenula ochraceoflavens]